VSWSAVSYNNGDDPHVAPGPASAVPAPFTS
jgi:hypothetical protein